MMAAGTPMQPASPTPLLPNKFTLLGVGLLLSATVLRRDVGRTI